MSANVNRSTLGNIVNKVSPPIIIISNNLMKLYLTVKGQSSTTVTSHTVYHHYNDIFFKSLFFSIREPGFSSKSVRAVSERRVDLN